MSALGLSRIEATGALLALWGAALEDAPDGYLEAWTDADLAGAMELPEAARSKPVAAALISSGFAERNGHGIILHDWMAYQGNLRAAKLKAAWRAAKDSLALSSNVRGQSEDSPKTSEDSPTLLADSRARADGTGRDVDGRESTSTPLPDESGASVPKPPPKTPKVNPEWLEAFHEHFWPVIPKKVDKDLALAAWCRVKPQTEDMFNTIMNGLDPWLEHWKTLDPSKILYPERWIKRKRWEARP